MSFILGFLYTIIIICSLLLILLVVLQPNRGSDFGLLGGSSQMVFGGKSDGLIKLVGILALIVFAGVFIINLIYVKGMENPKQEINEIINPVEVLDDLKNKSPQTTAPSPSENIKSESPKN